MPQFAEVVNETGIDLKNNLMVVGVNGLNLLEVQGAPDLRWQVPNGIVISRVTKETFSKVGHSIQAQFQRWGLSDAEAAKKYWGEAAAAANGGKDSQLYVVTGKAKGVYKLMGTSARGKMHIDVAVVPERKVKVAFKFVDFSDVPLLRNTTTKTPSDAKELTKDLNWIYGPQANITFENISADSIKVDAYPPPEINPGTIGPLIADAVRNTPGNVLRPVYSDAFLKYVAPLKNTNADVTVFFVHTYLEPIHMGGSQTFPEEHVCAVADNPGTPVMKGYDVFVVVLAHEMAHFLLSSPKGTDDHFYNESGFLLAKGEESSRIVRKLLFRLHKMKDV